jgi:pseudouridine synthase
MRLNQYIASSTELSRRAADTAIKLGRVRINNESVSQGQTVLQGDTVSLDGNIISPRTEHTYLILNKPIGYVSSRARQGEDPTLYSLLPSKYHSLRIAGRLDRDSSGLIVLTDDGSFIQHFTHPSGGKLKYYEITLDQPITAADRIKLPQGVMLNDGLSRVSITKHTANRLTVSLGEGRNRQLRRTFGALGYRVDRLHRISMGDFLLDSLPAGQWRLASASGAQL